MPIGLGSERIHAASWSCSCSQVIAVRPVVRAAGRCSTTPPVLLDQLAEVIAAFDQREVARSRAAADGEVAHAAVAQVLQRQRGDLAIVHGDVRQRQALERPAQVDRRHAAAADDVVASPASRCGRACRRPSSCAATRAVNRSARAGGSRSTSCRARGCTWRSPGSARGRTRRSSRRAARRAATPSPALAACCG